MPMPRIFKSELSPVVLKGFFGMTSTGAGVTISTLQQVEAWMRLVSGAIGIAIGIATLLSIIRHIKKQKS